MLDFYSVYSVGVVTYRNLYDVFPLWDASGMYCYNAVGGVFGVLRCCGPSHVVDKLDFYV